MKLSFRWYGKSDLIPLEYIHQIPGIGGIITAVYDIKPGEMWPGKSLAGLKKGCKNNGLLFDVMESIPIHEDIELDRGDVERLLGVYCENVRRCARYSVRCVIYNFVPVFDWTRAQLDKKGADGSANPVIYWGQMKGLDLLRDDTHLPDWDSSYTQGEMRELISAYGELGEEGLWSSLKRFSKKVTSAAEAYDVKMAAHPDDPPYPILSLPRIIICKTNLDWVLKPIDSPANCLCPCTDGLGCAKSNDVVAMMHRYSAMGRIAFMHIRNVKILKDGSFGERVHLSFCGGPDMYEIVKTLMETRFDGYARPDHGHMVQEEAGKSGYGLYNRALSAAYVNSLFEAYEKTNQ